MINIQARLFLNKLASYGIVAANETEGANLLGLGDAILVKCPRRSEEGVATKTACVQVLGAAADAKDGYSSETHASLP